MSETSRKFLIGVLSLLLAGTFIGWLYGRPNWGLLGACLVVLIWLVRQLLTFERALRTDEYADLRYGEGIWEQMLSKYRFEKERGARREMSYQLLLREVRKSTNAMPDGAVILDANNEIVTCNRAAKKLAGLKRKKDRGQRVDNILRAPELVKLLQLNDYESSVEITSPLNEGIWLNCRVVRYGADQKLLLLRDITERIRLSKMRRDFVANASHELRSPLTVISGYLDVISDDDSITDTWKNPVAQMRSQAARMRQILGELLELSRLESAGPAKFDEPVDVAELIDSSIQAFSGHANVAKISIDVTSTAKLQGNSAEIETVIVNLLSNAIRYTPADGVITVGWHSDANGADLVVADTGEGIDSEHIPRLTERFFRVDKGRSRDDGGIGLGLAIVKHVLARHDAELVVSSEAGVGSEFRCHFSPARRVVPEPVPLS